MKKGFTFLTLAVILQMGTFASLAEAAQAADQASAEQEDRVAGQAFETAIAKLDPLVRAKAGRPEEGMLTLRLLETYAKLAAVQFRLSHSPRASAKDKATFSRTLDATQRWASIYVTKFPRGEGVARAVYLRAKARGDAKNEEASIADYRYLIDQFPSSPDKVSAHLALYDLLAKKQDYRNAILYHRKLNVQPQDPHYALVIDQLAFAHYSLNEIPKALQLLEAQLAAFPETETSTQADILEREKIFGNAALYYFTGIDRKIPGYQVGGYLPYLLKLKPGTSLARGLNLFSNLLRTKSWDRELQSFQDQVLASKLPASAQAEVVLSSFESQIGRRRWAEVRATAQILTQLSPRAFAQEQDPARREKIEARMRKLMATAVDSLQKAFALTRGKPEGKEITEALLAVYEILLRSNPDPSTQAQIRYNIAETHSALGQLPQAVLRYRSVLELASRLQGKDRALVPISGQRALALRYDLLSKKGAFPRELKPIDVKLAKEVPLDPALEEWMAWVDEAPRIGAHTDAAYPTFRFETARVLYHSGRMRAAMERLKAWVAAEPTGKYATPAASLLVDTFLASQSWGEGYQASTEFEKRLTSADPKFKARLRDVAADCSFKMAEETYKKPDYAEVLKRVELLAQMYPQSARVKDGWILGANASLAMGDKAKALTYFARAAKSGVNADIQAQAILTALALAEENYRFGQAHQELRRAISLPEAALSKAGVNSLDLRRKAILYAWLSGEDALLQRAVQDRALCSKLEGECGKFALARAVRRGDPVRGFAGPFAKWAQALETLRKGRTLSLPDTTRALDELAALWGSLDPTLQFSLIAPVVQVVPSQLERLGALVERGAAVALDKKAIERRSRLIETVAGTLDKLTRLPFAVVQVAALQTWSDLYADFARGIRRLPKPAGLAPEDLQAYDGMVAELVAPFQSKGLEVREKAIAKVIETGVEEKVARWVWKAWLSEKPEALAELGGKFPEFPPGMQSAVPISAWVATVPKASEPWRQAVALAVRQQSLSLLTFLAQEAKEKAWATAEELQALRGFQLLVAGAHAEGIAELGWVARKLEGVARAAAIAQLASAYVYARSRVKAKSWIEFLAQDTDAPSRKAAQVGGTSWIAAAAWSGVQVSSELVAEWKANPGARLPATSASQGATR